MTMAGNQQPDVMAATATAAGTAAATTAEGEATNQMVEEEVTNQTVEEEVTNQTVEEEMTNQMVEEEVTNQMAEEEATNQTVEEEVTAATDEPVGSRCASRRRQGPKVRTRRWTTTRAPFPQCRRRCPSRPPPTDDAGTPAESTPPRSPWTPKPASPIIPGRRPIPPCWVCVTPGL